MNESAWLDPPEDAPVATEDERSLARERATEALGREPTEEEMAEWLRQADSR